MKKILLFLIPTLVGNLCWAQGNLPTKVVKDLGNVPEKVAKSLQKAMTGPSLVFPDANPVVSGANQPVIPGLELFDNATTAEAARDPLAVPKDTEQIPRASVPTVPTVGNGENSTGFNEVIIREINLIKPNGPRWLEVGGEMNYSSQVDMTGAILRYYEDQGYNGLEAFDKVRKKNVRIYPLPCNGITYTGGASPEVLSREHNVIVVANGRAQIMKVPLDKTLVSFFEFPAPTVAPLAKTAKNAPFDVYDDMPGLYTKGIGPIAIQYHLNFVEPIESILKEYWKTLGLPKEFTSQEDLVKAIYQVYAGNGEYGIPVSMGSERDLRVFPVPFSDISYAPVGREPQYLKQGEDFILYSPGTEYGQIVTTDMLKNIQLQPNMIAIRLNPEITSFKDVRPWRVVDLAEFIHFRVFFPAEDKALLPSLWKDMGGQQSYDSLADLAQMIKLFYQKTGRKGIVANQIGTKEVILYEIPVDGIVYTGSGHGDMILSKDKYVISYNPKWNNAQLVQIVPSALQFMQLNPNNMFEP